MMNEISENCIHQLQNVPTETIDQSNDNMNSNNTKDNEIKKIPKIEISDIIMEKTLYLMYQQIILNANDLIIDNQSRLLRNNYHNMSDLYTIMMSIYEFAKNPNEYGDDSGFSIKQIQLIYKIIEDKCENNGPSLIISAIDKFKSQNKDFLELIDSFIEKDVSNNNLKLNECQAVFYKMITSKTVRDTVFTFKKKTANENDHKKIKFCGRYGISYLKCPRNILVLSKHHIENDDDDFEHGILLHRDFNYGDNLGVVSYMIFEESFNFLFFSYLFKSYWSDRLLKDDFIEIYNDSILEGKCISSLFHYRKNEKYSELLFCPCNKEVYELAFNVLEICFLLLPFVPNSIIIKNDNPLCVIDFIGDMSKNKYKPKIYIIDEDDQQLPIPYPLNKITLDFAYNNIIKFEKENPLIWFSITGENFYYKENQGHEIESQFSFPDIDLSTESVFDPKHPSHLVLLIDQKFPYRPTNVSSLSWIPNSKSKLSEKTNVKNFLTDRPIKVYDTNINQNNFDISLKLLKDIGNIERASDIFFITLSGGYPVVLSGSIPEYIHGLVEYEPSDGNSIKRGIYHLIKHFLKRFIKKPIITESIQLKEISSTDHWKNYPTENQTIKNILNEICNSIKDHFKNNENNINVQFIGHSMLLLQIKGLTENLICKQIVDDIWNDDYQKCKADNEIIDVLKNISNNMLQVTDVTHERSIKVTVYHKKSYGICKDEFINRVNRISDMLGFFKLSISNYIENKKSQQDDIIGLISIELINTLVGVSFSSKIKEEFSSIETKNIESIRQNYVMYNNSYNNKVDETNIFITPSLDDMKYENNENSSCIYICEEPQILLKTNLDAYENFNIKPYSVCKNCLLETFKGMKDLQNVIDHQTCMINRKKLIESKDILRNFISINDKFPFGQGVWTLILSDDLISHYIKMWFVYNINAVLRISPRYFIFCKFHKDILYRAPKDGNDFFCPICELVYHSKCHDWHLKNDPCYVLTESQSRCPYCYVITEKTSGCSHMICTKCKTNWCNKCKISPVFDSSCQCYFHMMMEHNESYFGFERSIYHIYLNQTNENEIDKIEIETVKFKIFIPAAEVLIIHDRQNGNKLQICSYDAKYFSFSYISHQIPLVIDETYDYDLIISINQNEFCDDFMKFALKIYFGYTFQ